MADVQIFRGASGAVPVEYEIPASAEFILKAVTAEFDGSGAASAYLPCVTIVSDSGHVIARAVDPSVSVAAGASAEVSWFPGVKHSGASSSTSADAYPIHEDAPILGLNANAVWFDHWAVAPTIDTGCIHNAFLPSDGTQGAYVSTRFNIGPQYSIHEFEITARTGPDHGALWGYLASIPEDDPNAGSNINTNVLQDISTLNYVLCFKIDMYTVAAGKNFINMAGATTPGHSFFISTQFRPMGAPGTPFTTITTDANGVLADLDGGPGPYALKLVAGDKNVGSASYIIDLQSVHRQRVDWSFS
jgi:hypothetical protein